MGFFNIFKKKPKLLGQKYVYKVEILKEDLSLDKTITTTLAELYSNLEIYKNNKNYIINIWDMNNERQQNLSDSFAELTNFPDEDDNTFIFDHNWTYEEDKKINSSPDDKWTNKLIEWANKYKIKSFPTNKIDLTNLTRIDFSHWTYAFEEYKKVHSLPNEICKLSNLKILYLGSMYDNDQIQCELSELPDCIGELFNLEELYLSNQYKLKKLPKSIGKLENLKTLIMFNINIDVPEEIINLKKLNELHLPVFFKPTLKQQEWLGELQKRGCKIDGNVSRNAEYNPVSDITSELNKVFRNSGNDCVADFLEEGTLDEDEEYDNYNDKEDVLDEYGIDYIYHMTHYKNLESILENGLLAHNNDLVSENIDNVEVNDRRNKTEPINNENLHSYVPFYFNPKNPMLYVNKEIQEDIVILAFNRKLLFDEETIFTDGNAAVRKTKFFNSLDDLDELNWNCIHTRYWHDFDDGKREVMSEILVPKKVNIKHLQKIYCFDEATESFILELDDDLDVEVKAKMYF